MEGVIFISIYQDVLSEKQRLEKEIKSIQEQLCQLPEGKLNCVHNGNRIKWFHSDGHSQTYIPKTQKEYAKQLAMRTYLTKLEKDDENELEAIDFYLRHSAENRRKVLRLVADPAYQELLEPYFRPESKEFLSWANSPYNKNNKYPEQLKYKTCKNEYVRSKSEALIAMVLYMNKIPYRYECELKLGDVIVYADFTIRHPRTGELFYWEHFGMMDVPKYSRSVAEKIVLYMQNHIQPNMQLITTYETNEQPLDTGRIQELINTYFGEDLVEKGL